MRGLVITDGRAVRLRSLDRWCLCSGACGYITILLDGEPLYASAFADAASGVVVSYKCRPNGSVWYEGGPELSYVRETGNVEVFIHPQRTLDREPCESWSDCCQRASEQSVAPVASGNAKP